MGTSPTRVSCAVEAKDLIAATQFAARSLGKDSQDAILHGMRIESDGLGSVTVTGFDRDVMHVADIQQLNLDAGSGVVVVSGRKLAELVKTFPAKPVQITEEGASLSLVCGSVRVTLPLMTAEDYPALPEAPRTLGTMPAEVLREHVERVIAAADQTGKTATPAYTGVLWRFAEEGTVLDASNGVRVARSIAPHLATTDASVEDLRALIPWSVLADLVHVVEAGPVAIGLTANSLGLYGPTRTIVTRLLVADQFPKFVKFPDRAPEPTLLPIEEAREAVRRAKMATDPDDPIALDFREGEVTVSGTGSKSANDVRTDVGCQHFGSPLRIVVNPTYLDDALAACGTPVAELTMVDDDRRPIMVTAPDVPGFAHVVMPIRKR